MFNLEVTRFRCPGCRAMVDVAAQGQDFIKRMEAPEPVTCPGCRERFILDPSVWLFRVSLLLLVVTPIGLYMLTGQVALSYGALVLGGVSVAASLLSNRLVHYGEPEDDRSSKPPVR